MPVYVILYLKKSHVSQEVHNRVGSLLLCHQASRQLTHGFGDRQRVHDERAFHPESHIRELCVLL